MPRPVCTERMTLRLPETLLSAILDRAARLNCSSNHVVLNAIEHEFASTEINSLGLDYYSDIIPLVSNRKGDNVRQWRTQGGH